MAEGAFLALGVVRNNHLVWVARSNPGRFFYIVR